MEGAGVALGIAGLAGLFSACIDAYQLIQRGISFDKDYKILQTKFDNQELRLYAWGTACGLNGPVQDNFLEAPEVRTRIVATLQCIKGLFDDQAELRQKYGLRQPNLTATNGEPLSLTSSESESSSGTSARHALGTFFRRKKQQRSVSMIDTALWAIEDHHKFSELVQHLKDLNDDLESFTRLSNILRRQRVIVEYEVEEIEDIETLEEVELAGQDGSDIVSDTASVRLASIREGSIRTVSIIASSTDTQDSASFRTARSSLSIRERVSIEFGRDGLLLEVAGSNASISASVATPIPQFELPPEQSSVLPQLSATPALSSPQSSTPSQTPAVKFKVVAVSPRGCNTAILLTVFTFGYYPPLYQPTVFKDYVTDCRIDGRNIKLLLVDTAGEQDYPLLRGISLAGAHAVMICFRADQPLSESIPDINEIWLPEIYKKCRTASIVLVGVHDTEVEETALTGPIYEKQQRVRFAQEIGATKYVWCSPLTGKGVDDTFEAVARAVAAKITVQSRKKSRIPTLFRRLRVIPEGYDPTPE